MPKAIRTPMRDEYYTRPLSKFRSRNIDWLLPWFIPFGFLTTVAGDGEVGKSTMIYDLLARVTNGDPMPRFGDDPEHRVRRGSVLVLCKEDDPSFMIKPRFKAAGADTDRVHMIVTPRSRDNDDVEVLDRLDDTIEVIEDAIYDVGDVRAISLKGLSGSPVFVRTEISIDLRHLMLEPGVTAGIITASGKLLNNALPVITAYRNAVKLLGLWQGAWEASPDEVLAAQTGEDVRVPVGIGVVVPQEKILEVLQMPKLKALRREGSPLAKP